MQMFFNSNGEKYAEASHLMQIKLSVIASFEYEKYLNMVHIIWPVLT